MTTAAGRRLTEAHRLTQLAIASRLTAVVAGLAPRLDPDDFATWLTATRAATIAARRLSVAASTNYIRAFAVAETGTLGPPPLTDVPPLVAIERSLIVTGPATMRRHIAQDLAIADARNIATVRASRAAWRHALDGGREAIRTANEQDPRVVGYRRATSGKPCKYCSSQAARAAAGDSRAAFGGHDGCSCTPQPVYE